MSMDVITCMQLHHIVLFSIVYYLFPCVMSTLVSAMCLQVELTTVVCLSPGELAVELLPQVFDQDMSFFGGVKQGDRKLMLQTIQQVADQVGLTMKVGQGASGIQAVSLFA